MSDLLKGCKILDLTQMLAGPYGSMLLADMGAEVVKIENPEGGDGVRAMGPHFIEGESAYFLSINRNKKSLALDLKTEEGRKIFYRLVEKFDVVFENFRVAAKEKLGLTPENLSKINPRIITVSITAYGKDGPYKDKPAFDLILQAMGGGMSVTGEEGRIPCRMGLPMGDLTGGMHAALAIAGALYKRERTGKGSHIDLSLLDSQVSQLTYMAQYYFHTGEVPKPIGSGHQTVVPYQAFRSADIDFVIAVFTDRFWVGLCNAVRRKDLIHNEKFCNNTERVFNKAELLPILTEIFVSKPGQYWLERLTKEGVPCAPINSVDRVFEDEQVRMRNMLIEIDHPKCGKLKGIGDPIKVAGSPTTFASQPSLGENSAEILKKYLQMTDEEIKIFKNIGIIN